MMIPMNIHVLVFHSKDQLGIVASLSEAVCRAGGNIITADQYTTDPSGGDFFMRLEFVCDSPLGLEELDNDVARAAARFDGRWKLYTKGALLRMGILVSRQDHCLAELLYLWKSGELKVAIPFIASNYKGNEELAQQYGVPFYYIPASKDNRREEDLLALSKEHADFLVLARYMLVLSKKFLDSYGKDIINIHHGLLPSFKGADPYQQAFDHGVKIIGATAHFVNEHLDEGPIIVQLSEQVTHRDHVESLVRKGKNVEKRVLAQAVEKYLDYRVVRVGNKTVIF